MLRVLAMLAAPVSDPRQPDSLPPPLARAVVGHPRTVDDPQAVHFATRLYADLAEEERLARLSALLPFYQTLPEAFAGRMGYMVRDDVRACQALGRQPDAELAASAQD